MSRIFLFGVDSLTPRFLWRYLRKGVLPNLQRLISDGYSSELLPTIPPLTGPGWATIITGCWPSTHGVTGHFVRKAGGFANEMINAYSSYICKSKTIWELAEEQGKKVILVKFPLSWPPRNPSPDRVQVCGGGGFAEQDCPLQICHSRFFTVDKNVKDSVSWRVTPASRISFRKEENGSCLFVSDIEIHPRGNGEMDCLPKYYKLRVFPNDEKLFIYTNEGKVLCKLEKGEWSEWLTDKFELRSGGSVEGYFKFKLMNLEFRESEIVSFGLYLTQVHEKNRYTHPKHLASVLNRNVGFFVEHTDIHDYYAGWIDVNTLFEIWLEHTSYLQKLCSYLISNFEWELFFIQFHLIDYALHAFLGGVDPEHHDFEAEKLSYYDSLIERAHVMCDGLLGSILKELKKEDYVFVVGDHGHSLWRTSLMVNKFLVSKGYLTLDYSKQGKPQIDWNNTKVFATGVDVGACNVFINLKGREPNGIIEKNSKAYSELVRKLILDFYSLRTPDGDCPVKLVVTKEELDLFGLKGGDGFGDLIVFLRNGYENVADLPSSEEKYDKVFEKRNLGDFHTSEHGTFWPLDKNMRTFLIVGGPRIKKGFTSKYPKFLVSIAPTMSALAGIEAFDFEGETLKEFLD